MQQAACPNNQQDGAPLPAVRDFDATAMLLRFAAMSEEERDANPTSTVGASALRVRAATLHVKRGPDAGRDVRVDRPSFVVGTGDTADLRLNDPTVSREPTGNVTPSPRPQATMSRLHRVP